MMMLSAVICPLQLLIQLDVPLVMRIDQTLASNNQGVQWKQIEEA
jgi:hypothetical protein